MKLGTETGSLINHVMTHGTVDGGVQVGDAATRCGWSDRHPATVVEVFKKGKFEYITIQDDNATRIDKNGMSECQNYEYTRNPNGYTTTWRERNGQYEQVTKNENGRWVKVGGGGLVIGRREKYYDFSF